MKPMKNKSIGRIDIAVAWIISMAAWLLSDKVVDKNAAIWIIIGRCKTALLNAVPDLLAIIGAILIAYGISIIYLPAAWIAAGAECIAGL